MRFAFVLELAVFVGIEGVCLGQNAATQTKLPEPIDPFAEAYYSRAVEQAELGNSREAEAGFRAAWERRPAELRYVHGLAVHYIHSHQYERALDVIRDHVKREGPTALGWTLQGELLFGQKLYSPAYESLRNALELSNDNYRAHELIGLVLVVHKRYLLALEEMKIAAQQNPTSPQVRFYCGRLYYKSSYYAEARNEFLSCLKLKPDFPRALENLGLAYEALHEEHRAIECYRKAIDLDRSGKSPPTDEPYVELGLLLANMDRQEEATALLEEALKRIPNSAWANFELGRLLFQAGQDERAEVKLKLASQLDANYSRPHFFLGKLYQRSNRPQQAREEFATFQRLDKIPENHQPSVTRATRASDRPARDETRFILK